MITDIVGMTVEKIFLSKETKTFIYLQNYGFSEKIINHKYAS